ncbi:MAG: pyridoxal phosphate-dependent aminotransferase [Acidobacteriota bacterium]
MPPRVTDLEKSNLSETPIDARVVRAKIEQLNLERPGCASIREVGALVDAIESASRTRFIRMEMGIPGLSPCSHGIEAEVKALSSGCAARYPNIHGLPELKVEAARFLKAFLDLDVPPSCCIPSTGSTSGSFITFMVTARMFKERKTTLFLDPGFPVHKLQLKALGLEQISFDVYEYRGEKLGQKLESILRRGEISAILYSNPNNPTWICFSERELETIGELCTRYGVVVIEDLAYLGMDFRKDLSVPGKAPFVPTVGRYTDHYVLLVSASKIFSYAGQRIGFVAVSEPLFHARFRELLRFFGSERFGHALIYGSAYAVSAGVASSAQHGLAAALRAAADGRYNFLDQTRIYAERARRMKQIFLANGFYLVYDRDEREPLADGFYFTAAYPGFSGEKLVEELLYYGISAISLANTGSRRLEGIRACVSQVPESVFPELESRLRLFHSHHKKEPVEPSRAG